MDGHRQVAYDQVMTSDQTGNSPLTRMRDGRLEQIREHVDRVEHELGEIMELVTRMQADEPAPAALDVRGMQGPGERAVTSACWPVLPLQEDSASL
jgi:hypothetical protein